MTMHRCAVSLLMWLSVLHSPGEPQSISGQVVDSLSGAPVGRGFVVLERADGSDVERVLVGRLGQFTLDAPDGRYRLRSERIGFRAGHSDWFAVVGQADVQRILRVRALPVSLDGFEVTGVDNCNLSADEGTATVTLWGEARKALAAAAWTLERRRHRYVTALHDREVGRNGRRVKRERLWTESGAMRIPFVALDPARLTAEGYVVNNGDGTSSYYAPDATVLLHETFLDTHCFTVRRDRDRIGLAFRPAPGSTVPDVAGTLWLDQTSGELRLLEFRYTGIPDAFNDERVGGSVHFLALPSGEWIPRAWLIRMPTIGWSPWRDGTRRGITGYVEAAGDVLEVTDRQGQTVFAADPAIVSGALFDSTRAGPLAGARIRLGGTDARETTDAQGRFEIRGPFFGEYVLTADHPRLDSLGASVPPTVITLQPGTTVQGHLAVPSLATIEATLCADADLDGIVVSRRPGASGRDVRMVVGHVREGVTGRPVPGVEIFGTWQAVPIVRPILSVVEMGTSAVTDSTGRYVLCGLPIERTVAVSAALGDLATRTTMVRWEDTPVLGVRIDYDNLYATNLPMWPVDLELVSVSSLITSVSGVVTDGRSGTPLDQAEVSLPEANVVIRADSSGRFHLVDLPEGRHLLTVRSIGFRPVAFTVNVLVGRSVRVPRELTALEPAPVELAPLTVEADVPSLHLRGFEERRNLGVGGHFLDQQELARWNALNTTDVLRRVPGIVVSPNPKYGNGGDTRRWIVGSRRAVSMNQSGGGGCPVLYFLDGVAIGNSSDTSIDRVINIRALDAVEVYTGAAQVPAEFNRAGASCGVIVLWSRQ